MDAHTKITTYGVAKSEGFFTLVASSFKNFRTGYGLGLQLAKRDISAMYRQSLLGMLWAVFIPISQTLIWVLLNKGGVLTVGDTGVPYPLFVLAGTMLWQSFVESITSPLMMFNNAKSILSKININKESLIVAGLLKVMFNLCIRVVILIPVMMYYGIGFTTSMLLAPVAILIVVLFGHALGILITPLGVLYQDVLRFVQSFAQLFFFLTPIIYPARDSGFFGVMDKYNPAAICIGTARDLFLGKGMTDVEHYLVFVGVSVILTILGVALYRISLPIIIERMGS